MQFNVCLRYLQNGHWLAVHIFKGIFLTENPRILIQFQLGRVFMVELTVIVMIYSHCVLESSVYMCLIIIEYELKTKQFVIYFGITLKLNHAWE